MRKINPIRQIKLYSFTLPLLLLPLMDITFSGIWDYMRGLEFRSLMAQVVTQVISGVVDAFIIAGFGVIAG